MTQTWKGMALEIKVLAVFILNQAVFAALACLALAIVEIPDTWSYLVGLFGGAIVFMIAVLSARAMLGHLDRQGLI
jgi:hypothetical protein